MRASENKAQGTRNYVTNGQAQDFPMIECIIRLINTFTLYIIVKWVFMHNTNIYRKILMFTIPVFFLLGIQMKPVEDHDQLWKECKLEKILSEELFARAMSGYNKIEQKGKNILTIIDFNKPSTEKRLFVIDLKRKELLYHSFVAHGKNSGANYAKHFSNQSGSLKSCLGFFITGETYYGKHGYSLRLDGLEKGINDNARKRSIVMHGADYVSQDFIDKHGRLGRSWGCPALPVDSSKEIIDFIANGSCLFIFATDKDYLEKSVLL